MTVQLATLWRLFRAQSGWLRAKPDDIIEVGMWQAMMGNAANERMYWGIADTVLKMRLGRETLPW